MNEPETINIFAYVWEYFVLKEALADFEKIYGPNGDWVQLFEKSEGYLGTELYRDMSKELRYLTTDYWVSRNARDAFLDKFTEEFAELDQRCELLTEKEVFLGDFELLGGRLEGEEIVAG